MNRRFVFEKFVCTICTLIFCVCTAEAHWQTHWELHFWLIKTQNEGFGVAKSMSGLKLRLRCYGLTLNRSSMFKHFQHNRIKNILHVRVSQNFSTTVWNSHSQLFQILDCGFCCQGAHKKLLGFQTGTDRFGWLFSINKLNDLKTLFCIYSAYLCLTIEFVWWSLSFIIISTV